LHQHKNSCGAADHVTTRWSCDHQVVMWSPGGQSYTHTKFRIIKYGVNQIKPFTRVSSANAMSILQHYLTNNVNWIRSNISPIQNQFWRKFKLSMRIMR